MAREGGGGGGAFGWLILGVVVGVAGTLAVETLLGGHHSSEAEQPASATAPALAVVTSAPAEAPVPPPVAHEAPSAAPSAAPATHTIPAMQPSNEDVQDDAAAAGMTSRSHASSTDSPN